MNESNQNNVKEDNFKKACQILKKRRQDSGFSIEELSQKTRLSKRIISALENGLANELPENTYLGSMLLSIEKELKLNKGALDGALINNKKTINAKKLKFLTPDKLFILSTSKGGIIYFLLMLLSLFILNKQMLYLNIINSNTVQPINPGYPEKVYLEKNKKR
tara:strand:- start:77 stop:565 length:489 start_codon:yes stop_codon:yes gene_type:complete